MQLDVESLRAFLAVLDAGGMTRAAERLHLSQSAVSWKIRRLEDRVGRPLFVREGHSLRLSSDGRALVDDARSIVSIHDRAVSRLESSDLTGTVRLGSNDEVSATHMAAVLGKFTRVHPGARVEFVSKDSESIVEALDAGELDVAVIQVGDADIRNDDLVLWSDQLRWLTCCETPYESGMVPLITFGENCFYRPLSEPMLEAAGIDHAVAFSGPSASGVHAAVTAGLGVAVLAERFIGGDLIEWERGAALGPLPLVHQIARTRNDRDALAEALLDAISEELVVMTAA
jgi:DNA-binding transcriptional LysR family regulator